jgi:hypothetical protein
MTTAADLPPPAALMHLLTGGWISSGLYVAAKLGIADLLADGPRSAADLAKAAGADADALNRVLRMLAGVGVFAEVEGRYTLTPVASCLRSGTADSMRAAAILFGEDHQRAWDELIHSVKTGKPAFDHVYGMNVFAYYEKNRAAGEVFNEAMTSFSRNENSAMIAAADWKAVKKVVDVGGGHGALISLVLEANPGLTGVLFDAPAVIEGARKRLLARGLASRCEAVGGDFFAAVPPGGDVYLLSHIIHDWDDARSEKILANIHGAMNPSGRVLLVEYVLPPGNTFHPGKLLDVNMLVMCPGGRERTEAEFARLLGRAGFKLARILATRSPVSVIEAVRA